MWRYPLVVQQVDDVSEPHLIQVFDRINRNVAKLRPQELRHARSDGAFITLCERLAVSLPDGFPNITAAEKKRMADVEYVSLLLIYIVQGTRSVSQSDLDELYIEWDGALPPETDLESRHRENTAIIDRLLKDPAKGDDLRRSRLRNRADFYSLCAAIDEITAARRSIDPEVAAASLVTFAERVERARGHNFEKDPPLRDDEAARYYEAVRSASNDPGPRTTRIAALRKVLVES